MSSEPSKPDLAGHEPDVEERAAAVPDRQSPPALYPREIMVEVFVHARECYPEECCGLLIGEPGGAPRQIVRCTNVQSQRFSKGESQLDAGRGFWIDEQQIQAALNSAEQEGETLCAVYHSHVDTGAYLSHTDLLAATGPDGTPIWPGVAQLIVSVRNGAVEEAAVFEWDSEVNAFLGRTVREGR